MATTDISGLMSFAFGDTPAKSDAFVAQIIAGTKRAATAPLRDLGPGGEPMPIVGQRYVVLDVAARAGAIIEETDVFHCRFDELTPAFAAECGADNFRLWLARQAAYFEKYGGWSEGLELVCDRFKPIEALPR
jgi:uncharacterized protein YhfF